MDIQNKVLNYINDNNLISCGDSLICAVSGGADSVCMLDILVSLKEYFSLKLYVAHLNHSLRGKESDSDEQFVKELCKKYSLPFYSKTVNVKELSKELKVSCEEAGRIARYDFFNELREKLGVCKVCTAHNKNDNAETVLMRILRGTDITGLSGISPFNDNYVIRPVLCLLRSEIEDYLQCKGLDFVTDSTNAENDFTRNKIRNILIPSITNDYNNGFIDTISSNIELFKEADSFIEEYVNNKYTQLTKKGYYGLNVDINSLLKENKYIAKRIIKKAIYSISKLNITNSLCDIIYNSLTKDNIIAISKEVNVYIKYNKLYFVNEKPRQSFLYHFTDYGMYYIPEMNSTFEISEFKGIPKNYDKNTIFLPVDKFNLDFILRSKKNGDKMHLLNCGTKKISDIFTDEKIPSFLRSDIPVLEYNNEIMWLCGMRTNYPSCQKEDKTYIKFSIHKEKDNE